MRRAPSDGTQSIDKVIVLLKALGSHRKVGWRLTDLAVHCGYNDSTVHRIMSCLSRAGLVQQRPYDRRYAIGPLCFELSLTQPTYIAFQNECQKYLLTIARKTGWFAAAFLRSGEESVCIQRKGTSSLHSMLDIGHRRPLAATSWGVSILMALPYQERRAIQAANRRTLRTQPSTRMRDYEGMWKVSAARGVGLNMNHVVKGSASISVAVRNAKGYPFASIGVLGPYEGLAKGWVENSIIVLNDEANHIQEELKPLIAEMQREIV